MYDEFTELILKLAQNTSKKVIFVLFGNNFFK